MRPDLMRQLLQAPTKESMQGIPGAMKVRTVWISDIHLGTRACQAERLLDFLREHTADELYLIGDNAGDDVSFIWQG